MQHWGIACTMIIFHSLYNLLFSLNLQLPCFCIFSFAFTENKFIPKHVARLYNFSQYCQAPQLILFFLLSSFFLIHHSFQGPLPSCSSLVWQLSGPVTQLTPWCPFIIFQDLPLTLSLVEVFLWTPHLLFLISFSSSFLRRGHRSKLLQPQMIKTVFIPFSLLMESLGIEFQVESYFSSEMWRHCSIALQFSIELLRILMPFLLPVLGM